MAHFLSLNDPKIKFILFSYNEAFFSRKIPASERRRKRIKELEDTLLEHPLMLLPGLEEGLEPELYDEVIDILDPDLLDTIAEVDLDSVERNGIIGNRCL